MADEYKTVGGFVQFDPNEREFNGKTLQDVLIQNLSGNFDVRVTIWPEAGVTAAKGDLLFASGKYKEREHNGRTYRDLSASKIKVFPADGEGPRAASVVNALASEGSQTDDPIF